MIFCNNNWDAFQKSAQYKPGKFVTEMTEATWGRGTNGTARCKVTAVNDGKTVYAWGDFPMIYRNLTDLREQAEKEVLQSAHQTFLRMQ